jgi:hypothetical protein
LGESCTSSKALSVPTTGTVRRSDTGFASATVTGTAFGSSPPVEVPDFGAHAGRARRRRASRAGRTRSVSDGV